MSTLAVYFTKNKITIVNDSMGYDVNDNPMRFTSKTKTYPNLRCAINCLGMSRFSRDLRNFIEPLPISDFSTLILYIKENLFEFLSLDFEKYSSFKTPECGVIASALLMGYSEDEKRMSAHTFYLYNDRLDYIENDINNKMKLHTDLSLEDENQAQSIAANIGGINKVENYLVELLKIQHAKFKLGKNSIPSGLEIHSTVISIDGGFSIKQSIPYRFPTFSQDFLTILDNTDNGKN